MTDKEDIALVAERLADLTHEVETLVSRADSQGQGIKDQKKRADTQQERMDLAARQLAEVSERLQAAANALRESI